VYEEGALRAAEGVLPEGPLRGVPVTVKDSFDLAGRVTGCGSRLRRDCVAEGDAVVVERLRRAGAIVVGKTACPEFLMNWETESHLVGATRNPRNEEWTAGGSSGGEGAAIGGYCSAGGVGSDGGGSIRLPASFCGIYGLKPTPGRVPAVGHWPEIGHPGGLLGVAGPMARTVGDVGVLLGVLAGHDARDPFSVPGVEWGGSRLPKRVAVVEGFAMTAEVGETLERAARGFAEAGMEVERAPAGLLAGARELWEFLFIEVNAPLLRGYIAGREEECHWTGLELIDRVKGREGPSAAELCGVLMERDRLRGRVCRYLEEGERVLLGPVCGRGPWRPGERDFDLLEAVAPLTFANLLGLPALGMPAGVQVVGAPWGERGVLGVARVLEREG
jgi:amidase